MEFVNPDEIRRKNAQLLQKQLAGARKGLKGTALSGFGIGQGLSAIAQRFAPKTAEEKEAEESNDILGEVMGELEMSGPQDPESLPAEKGAEFASVAREKFFDAGDWQRAAFFAEKQQEQEAQALAQDQLKESTEEMRKNRKAKDDQKKLDDQKVLVVIDKNGRPSLYHNPAVNGGQAIIKGATTPEGIEGIESQIAVAQQLGKTVIPLSLQEYAEAALGFDEGGFGVRYGTKEQQKMREAYKDQTQAIAALAPLTEQLIEDPGALQGIRMKPDGTMKKGVSNALVSAWQGIGEEYRRVTNISADVADVTVAQDGVGGGHSVKSLVEEGLAKFAISGNVAQARVIGLAYAIARARDSGGRLSDQDVALALRSLTGAGSAREIALLFGDMVRSAGVQIEALEALVSNDPTIIPQAQRDLYLAHKESADANLEELMMVASNIGVAPSAGDASGVNIDPSPTGVKKDAQGKAIPLEPDALLDSQTLLDSFN
jgi:hypothetical protein